MLFFGCSVLRLELYFDFASAAIPVLRASPVKVWPTGIQTRRIFLCLRCLIGELKPLLLLLWQARSNALFYDTCNLTVLTKKMRLPPEQVKEIQSKLCCIKSALSSAVILASTSVVATELQQTSIRV